MFNYLHHFYTRLYTSLYYYSRYLFIHTRERAYIYIYVNITRILILIFLKIEATRVT